MVPVHRLCLPGRASVQQARRPIQFWFPTVFVPNLRFGCGDSAHPISRHAFDCRGFPERTRATEGHTPLSRLIEFDTGVAVGAIVTDSFLDDVTELIPPILENRMCYQLEQVDDRPSLPPAGRQVNRVTPISHPVNPGRQREP